MNFREVVSMFPGHKKTPSRIEEYFRSFYLGFNPGSIIWISYRDDDNNFETLFSFDDIHRNDENKIVFVEVQTRASSFMHFWQGSISYLLIL
jgi:hypothetical protein